MSNNTIEMMKKIETAQQMLAEGSDPFFVSKLTGISPEIIKTMEFLAISK